MKTYYASGRIIPESSQFSWQGISARLNGSPGDSVQITIFIQNSQLVAKAVCSGAQDLPTIRNRIVTLGDNIAAYASFFQLQTVSCEIESFYSAEFDQALANASNSHVMDGGSRFGEKITFKKQDVMIDIAPQLLSDHWFTRAIYELRQSARQKDFTALHCYFAIESIRNAFGEKEKSAWQSMREALRLSEEILKSFKAVADDQRHGKNTFQTWQDRQEAMQIGWEVVWRYLKFVSNDRVRLSSSEFPDF